MIVETAVSLHRNGYKVVIVSSGAIGVALQQMQLPHRPEQLPQVQALAAIGQCRLIGLWDQLFERLGQTIAQILLTRNDIADRTQYVNAQNTLSELLEMGVIPIVNENDTLAVTEIKFGDNDTLSAIAAGMIQADYLFLMTDVDCLYDKNPRSHPDARAIEVVENISDLEADVSSAGSALGTGGMSTKIVAARLATAAGVTTIITRSSKPGNVASIVNHLETLKLNHRQSASDVDGDATTYRAEGARSNVLEAPIIPEAPLHTRFLPSQHPIGDRRFWLLHGLKPHGIVFIDPGAAYALSQEAGLRPVGVVDVEGSFAQQECVRLVEVPRKKPLLQQNLSQIGVSIAPADGFSNRSPRTERSPGISPHTPEPLSSLMSDPAAREIGRAVVNYSAAEIRLVAGLHSRNIAKILGYADSEYVALGENIAMAGAGERLSRPQTPTAGPFSSLKSGVRASGLAGYVEG